MPDPASKPVFLVDAYSDPVLVRIDGRACFQNSAGLRDFIGEMRARGKSRFVLDFHACTSMDSTFLGVLAGVAIELHKSAPAGCLVVARAGTRNLELLRNLGLHRLLTIEMGDGAASFRNCETALESRRRSEVECARLVLEAHENLVAADEGNRAKFQDVLAFLRNRAEPK
jgi:anti-anti-sigma regulatory factor